METRNDRGHRVVITGAGLLTPIGLEVDTTWRALLAGTSGAAPITLFEITPDYDVRFAAEVKGFQPENFMEKKEAKRMDRFVQFAVMATHEALRNSGLDLDKVDRTRVGVVIGSGIG
ncbi:MAG TPA: beta-ketoacyl synthase N-terminal-like domain-containing protein, partial [Longimicrobiales bacterium]|nr:beta-ketoacyl synthase N-terminal-like domain-containing protein [Longimicrobiales bacterium]